MGIHEVSVIWNIRVTVTVACVAGGFKGLRVYGEGNYGERNEKDA